MNVAITYHYFAIYRLPVLRALMTQRNPRYELISGKQSNLAGLKTIDPELAERPVEKGGLRWKLIRNYWLKKWILWQSGHIALALASRYDTLIFLGDRRFLSTWVSALLARLTGKRVLMWTHGLRSKPRSFAARSNLWFYRLAHGLLLYGHRARKLLIDEGFKPSALHVVYNSLDYEAQKQQRERLSQAQIQDTRQELFAHSEDPVLVFIGRLIENKKLDMLVEACSRLNRSDRPVNLLLIGEGPLRESLEQQARNSGCPERFRLYGACYDETELARLLLASDLCVCPGALGLTAMHCLAYGLPVITSDCMDLQKPEVEAIQPGMSGQFYRHGDIEDLTEQIRRWLNRSVSRAQTAEDCIRVIEERYNPRTQVDIINRAVRGEPAR